MRWPITAALAIGGSACSLVFSPPAQEAAVDAAVDAAPIEVDACQNGGCDGLVLNFGAPGSYVLNTDTGELLVPSGEAFTLTDESAAGEPVAFRVTLQEFHLGDGAGQVSELRIVGGKGIILKVPGNLIIDSDGRVDVSSRQAGPQLGAGAENTMCMDQVAMSSEFGGAGGAGGSLNGNGGGGGSGDADGAGTTPIGAALPWQGLLMGGCAGGLGAPASNPASSGGVGGPGGGAIKLEAGGTIHIAGLLDAGGAGGAGGELSGGGGGGGGSGGTIWLEAPSVIIAESGSLRAKGGGGGEAANACVNGLPGQDAQAAAVNDRAKGGLDGGALCNGVTTGGGGGDGSVGGADGMVGVDGASAVGGGGGGGSPGYIVVAGSTLTVEAPATNISPPIREP